MPPERTTDAQKAFASGYVAFERMQGASIGAQNASDYVSSVDEACQILENDINQFKGFETDVKQLKGDVGEFSHADIFNINAALRQSSFKAVVDRSHDYASPDIRIKQGDRIIENYGLKYLRDARSTANAQAISQFQRFCEYKAESGNEDLSFEAFLEKRGMSPEDVLQNDPIYTGQTRIIPADQRKEAIAYLRYKIAKEKLIRPEQVKRYQDTLDHLQSRLKAPDGTESNDITTEEAIAKARHAKEGSYRASDDGFTTQDLIQFEHILKQGLKSGTSAAVITLVLKLVPDLYRILDEMIVKGYIDVEELKNAGFSTLSASATSFIRGFVSASLTTACKSGIISEAAKSISPGVIAGLTVILMNTASDFIKLKKGKITKGELSYNLSRTIFVTSCAIGLGSLTQLLIPLPFAYLLGNFVGSVVATFVFTPLDSLVMSFCIYSGFTFFGLVEQNYVLPDEVIKELGVDVFAYERYFPIDSSFDKFQPDTFTIDDAHNDMIHILRRGVISVHRIGYQYM